MEGNMAIYAIGAMRRAKLMIGGRILALAIQFTLTRDAAGQQATSQLVPLLYRQSEIALVTGACQICEAPRVESGHVMADARLR
jgi:hypothetical protein